MPSADGDWDLEDVKKIGLEIKAELEHIEAEHRVGYLKGRLTGLPAVVIDALEPFLLAKELAMANGDSKDHRWEKIVAVAFGIGFIVVMLVIAIKFPNPTPYQYTTFRIVLAIACAGFASVIPGVLNVNVGAWLRAGGALAVFAIVYFYSPAGLVTERAASPSPTDPFTIYLVSPSGNNLTASSYQFPYADIEKNRSFQDFSRILSKLPNQQPTPVKDPVIFRVNDERTVTANNGVDVTTGGNISVIVAPRSVVQSFKDQHLAFTYLHSQLRR
jgi:hypothetical protein